MTDAKIEKMLMEIIKNVDYDIWKNFDEPEEPEFAEEEMDVLIGVVKKYLK